MIASGATPWLSLNQLTQCSKDAATNPRGIPYAPFVDKVEDYVSSRAEVDGTMKSFQEMISYDRGLRLGRQLLTGFQQIPVYGSQHPAASRRLEGENPRHTKDLGHGSIP